VVEATGQPVVFSLTARHDRTEAWKELLALSDGAAAAGLPIRPVFPPRPIGILLGLEGSQNPFSGCPSYKEIAHLPGFEPSLLLNRLPRVLGEPDLRRMGLQVAKGLAERGVVHLLRDVLVTPAVRQAAGVSGA